MNEGNLRKQGPDGRSGENEAGRRKPARRWQHLRERWRALGIVRKHEAGCTCRWKTFRTVKTSSLDGGVVEAILASWLDLTRAD
jgi:hypothetical protein